MTLEKDVKEEAPPKSDEEFAQDKNMNATKKEDNTGRTVDEEDEPLLGTEASLDELTDTWAQGTSIHGLAYVFDKDNYSIWKRLLWALLVLAATGLLIWQILSLVDEYKSYEVTVNTHSFFPGEQPFPDITVCNYNDFMEDRREFYEIFDDPKNEDEWRLITQDLEEFIHFTEYNEQDYSFNQSEVWSERFTSFGRCFTFHSDRMVSQPGTTGGLYFGVYLDQYNYELGNDLAGALVFVTQPGVPITFEVPFTTVSPGKDSLIFFERNDYEREKEAPWARCAKDPNYTYAGCIDECMNEVIREECECQLPTDPNGGDLPWCVNDMCEDYRFGDKVVDTIKSCECTLPPCRETLYKTSHSDIGLSQNFLSDFEADFNVTSFELLDNWAFVYLNFGSMQYDKFTESKAVSFRQLLASIGGSMGLFLGISALSVFELFGDFAALRFFPWLFGYRRRVHGFGGQT